MTEKKQPPSPPRPDPRPSPHEFGLPFKREPGAIAHHAPNEGLPPPPPPTPKE